MVYTKAFKARKYVLKSGYFTLLFLMHAGKNLYYWLKKLHMEAVREQGQCGNCKKMNLKFSKPVVTPISVYRPFICIDCGKKGKEVFTFEYIKTEMQPKKEVENGDSTRVKSY